MSRPFLVAWRTCLGTWALWALLPLALPASERPKGVGPANPENETVDLFSAIGAGQLEVRLVPADSSQCRLLVKNKTQKPLNVRIPQAFAGVPVLAQFQNPNLPFPQGPDANANSNAPQALGVGVPGAQNPWGNNRNQQLFNLPGPMNMQGPGVGLWNIAPEKVGQWRLPAVCLEHGRPEPRPAVAYEVRPIESVAPKPEVAQLCAMLARGEVSHAAAQAAAWNLNNGLSWDELKSKRLMLPFGVTRPFFQARELADAKKAVERAARLIEQGQAGPSQSPGE